MTVNSSPPVFTSAASTTFSENNADSFSVTAKGDTPIAYTETGTLPSGVTLASNGTLSGIPAFLTAGTYPITITATDVHHATTTQSFTLKVSTSPPVFTSAASTTFSENNAGTFSVTAKGDTPIAYTEKGTLPTGVTLAGNGTLSGTPAFLTAGTYPITITATDVNHATTTQAFTLKVSTSPPVFTSATSTTFSENNAGTFSVTANGDTPIAFTETGALPSGVTLAGNGTLSGTPAFANRRDLPDHRHRGRLLRRHHHPGLHLDGDRLATGVHLGGIGHLQREQRRNLLGDGQRGHADRLHRDGGPALRVSPWPATAPCRAHRPFGTAGTYPITVTATDSNHTTTTQAFTLTVTASPPVFTSAASATFSEHHAGTFSVAARGDKPIAYTETGALPAGVTLASDGTLSGTPAIPDRRHLPDHRHRHRRPPCHHHPGLHLGRLASAPVFTSAASTTFTAPHAGTFAVTARGDKPIAYTENGGPALRGHPGQQRHPVGHTGSRGRRHLPDHRHRYRHPRQEGQPTFRPRRRSGSGHHQCRLGIVHRRHGLLLHRDHLGVPGRVAG